MTKLRKLFVLAAVGSAMTLASGSCPGGLQQDRDEPQEDKAAPRSRAPIATKPRVASGRRRNDPPVRRRSRSGLKHAANEKRLSKARCGSSHTTVR